MIADGNDRGVYSSIANFGDSDFFKVPLLRGQGQMESMYDFVARTGSSREDGQNCLLVGCFCSRSNVCFADTDCRPK